MRFLFSVFFIITIFSYNLFSESTGKSGNANIARVVKSDNHEIILEFNSPDLNVISMADKGVGYVLEGFSTDVLEPGKPHVPIIEKLVKISGKGSVSIEVISSKSVIENNVVVAPYQLPPSTNNESAPYAIDQDIYTKGELYPAVPVLIKDIEVIGDFRFARIQFFPVSYSALKNEVTITKSITFKMVSSEARGENELKRNCSTPNSTFLPFYEDALNIDFDMIRSSARKSVPDYIFIGNSSTLGKVQDLINWKIRKGLNVTVANTSDIGNTVSAIDSYLEDFYNTKASGDLFVLLVGDENVIPSKKMQCQYSYVNCPSDNIYGVIGSGYTPSIHVGRITDGQKGLDAYEYQAWKIVQYESDPQEGPWMGKSMTWGCSSPNGQPTASYWKNQLEEAGLSCEMELEASGAQKGSALVSTFNSGLSTFSMKGHGNDQSWASAKIGIGSYGFASVSSMDVGGRMCWINNIACLNSRFEYSSYVCFAEQMMATGSIGNAQGCIGMYSFTVSSSGGSPTDGSDGMLSALYDGLFHRDMRHVGVAASFGTKSAGTQGDKQASMVWGCPEMDLFFKYPLDEINVQCSDPAPGSFNVSTGVKEALVSVVTSDYKPLASGYADESGDIALELPEFSGMVYLTVTARNCKPVLKTYDGTGVSFVNNLSKEFKVECIHLNRNSGSVNIQYSLSKGSKVDFTLYTVNGREIYKASSKHKRAGKVIDNFKLTSPLAEGLYVYCLETEFGIIRNTISVLE